MSKKKETTKQIIVKTKDGSTIGTLNLKEEFAKMFIPDSGYMEDSNILFGEDIILENENVKPIMGRLPMAEDLEVGDMFNPTYAIEYLTENQGLPHYMAERIAEKIQNYYYSEDFIFTYDPKTDKLTIDSIEYELFDSQE